MMYRVFLLLFIVLPLTDTKGQRTALANFINCIELQNGPDNLLINGRPYVSQNPNGDGHPYLVSEEWKPGTVYINGNPYPSNQLKYNLFLGQLIIRHDRPNGTNQTVILSDLLVDSFLLDERLFVDQDLVVADAESVKGYLEQIYSAQLSFFRFQKKIAVTPSNSKPYGGYSKVRDVYYLIMDSEQHKITQMKDFLACFPDHKSQIRKYMKEHSLRWNKMNNTQFTNLLKFCHDQI